MASIAIDPNGRRRILFVAANGSRKTIRLGKIDRKSAETICRHIEALLAAKIGGQPVPRDTAAWLSDIGAKLRDKLAAVGLVEPLQRLTIQEFLMSWLDSKKSTGHKPTSLRAWGQTAGALSSILAVVLWQAWHMPTAKRFAQRCKGAACGRQRSTNGWATPGKCWKMRYGWGMFPRTLGSTFGSAAAIRRNGGPMSQSRQPSASSSIVRTSYGSCWSP